MISYWIVWFGWKWCDPCISLVACGRFAVMWRDFILIFHVTFINLCKLILSIKWWEEKKKGEGVRRGSAHLCSLFMRTESWWPPSGLACTVWQEPSAPSAPGTKEGNLICHNMARGLSTAHLFAWCLLRRSDMHITVARTHTQIHGNARTHGRKRDKMQTWSVAETGRPLMAVCRGSEVGVMWGESRTSTSWAAG